jgi:hypothetical protein
MAWYDAEHSVTFLDNHDTAGELHDRFGMHTSAYVSIRQHTSAYVWYDAEHSVTFLDNHDTAAELHDRFGMLAYADVC